MTQTNDWGDLGYPEPLPNHVIYREPPPVTGVRLPNGNIHCQGCLKEIPDNSAPGFPPSCPNCWAAVSVQPEPRQDPPAPRRRAYTPEDFGFTPVRGGGFGVL